MIALYRDSDKYRIVSPHAYQTISLLADVDEMVFSTGQGSGKTSWSVIWLLINQYLRNEVSSDVIFTEPTSGMLERVALPEFMRFVKDTVFEGDWKNKKYGEYENRFGLIHFVSADAPEHIQGIHAVAAVMDEAGQCSRQSYYIIRGRLNQKRGKLLILTNPYKNKDPWLYREVYQRYKAGDKNILFFNYSSIINPSFDRDKYEKDKLTLPAYEFEFQYEGIYSKPQGLVYDIKDEQICDVDLEEGRTYAGMDFGVGDPTVLLVGHKDKNGLHIINEYYRASLAPSEHVSEIANRINTYKINMIFYKGNDHGGLVSKLEIDKGLQEKGIHVIWKSVDPDIQKGIRIVNELLRTNLITFSTGLTKTLDEANGYVFGSDGLPVDKDNHCMDSLKYLCVGIVKHIAGVKHTPPVKAFNWFADYWKKVLEGDNEVDWINYR